MLLLTHKINMSFLTAHAALFDFNCT